MTLLIDWISRPGSMPMKLDASISSREKGMLNPGLRLFFCALQAISLAGCADFEEVEIRREPSPDKKVVATLNRSSAGAWDSFSYFVNLKGGDYQSRVAMIRRPKYIDGIEQIYLDWNGDNMLLISATNAERAELIRDTVLIDGREINIQLSTTNQ
jgi:hypothetical protein